MNGQSEVSPDEIRARVQERAKRQSLELSLTRERAANWSKGVGALLVAALAFSLIKGRDDLTSLDPAWARSVGICLAVAALLATIAAYQLFRASFGPLRALADNVTDHQEATATMRALTCGLGVSVLAFAVLLGAVGATWYGPSADGPAIAVTDQDGTVWCGEPQETRGGELVLSVDGQRVKFDFDTVLLLEAIETCSDQ